MAGKKAQINETIAVYLKYKMMVQTYNNGNEIKYWIGY